MLTVTVSPAARSIEIEDALSSREIRVGMPSTTLVMEIPANVPLVELTTVIVSLPEEVAVKV
jgi:hypothetical protein